MKVLLIVLWRTIQSDQKENKSDQVQIIGHVVAESCANKRSTHGHRQFVVSNANASL
jgi:hypothetical protein